MKILANENNEQAVIATALLSQGKLADITTLVPEDFYYQKYKKPFEVIIELAKEKIEISLITVYDRLIKRGKREVADKFFQEFLQQQTSPGISAIVKSVKDLSDRRHLHDLCLKMAEEAENDIATADDVSLKIFNSVREIQSGQKSESAQYGDNGLGHERFFQNFLPTGLDFLDEIIHGFSATQLVVIGARAKTGKSAFVLNIALNVAQAGKRVLMFTLEMDVSEIELRMTCIKARVEMDKIVTGRLSEDEMTRFAQAEEEFLSMRDRFSLIDGLYDLQGIIAEAKREAMREPLDLIIVDYLQLIRAGIKADRYVQVGEISRELKLLAKELKTPVLAPAQLNRLAEDEEPQLKHLRESGSIEQDANIIIFLNKDKKNSNGIIDVIVAGNRQGRVGKRPARFLGKFQTFENVEPGIMPEEKPKQTEDKQSQFSYLK